MENLTFFLIELVDRIFNEKVLKKVAPGKSRQESWFARKELISARWQPGSWDRESFDMRYGGFACMGDMLEDVEGT